MASLKLPYKQPYSTKSIQVFNSGFLIKELPKNKLVLTISGILQLSRFQNKQSEVLLKNTKDSLKKCFFVLHFLLCSISSKHRQDLHLFVFIQKTALSRNIKSST